MTGKSPVESFKLFYPEVKPVKWIYWRILFSITARTHKVFNRPFGPKELKGSSSLTVKTKLNKHGCNRLSHLPKSKPV